MSFSKMVSGFQRTMFSSWVYLASLFCLKPTLLIFRWAEPKNKLLKRSVGLFLFFWTEMILTRNIWPGLAYWVRIHYFSTSDFRNFKALVFSDTGNNINVIGFCQINLYIQIFFLLRLFYIFLKGPSWGRYLHGTGWLELCLVASFVGVAVIENLAFTGFFISHNKQVWK